jgi:hypothetical protein
MTAGMSEFILGLRPIEQYFVSGRLPGETSVYLAAKSCMGGALAMQGRRSGFFSQKSEGVLTTPFGNVSFSGSRKFVGNGEHVSLVCGERDVSGRLNFPGSWRIVSWNSRASLWISSDTTQDFEVWKPSVRFQETVGRFRSRNGKAIVYRLFSQNDGDKVFEDDAAFSRMQDGEALVFLASLLYACIYPGLVLDME